MISLRGSRSRTGRPGVCPSAVRRMVYAPIRRGPTARTVTMPCVALATSDVGPEHAGLASGLVNSARQVGGAIGLAALASIASSAAAHSSAGTVTKQAVHGYNVGLVVAAALAVLISLCATAARVPKR